MNLVKIVCIALLLLFNSATVACTTYDTITEVACESYFSPSGKVWDTSGTYQDTIPNFQNCDSVITVYLTVNKNVYTTIFDTVCDLYISPGRNAYFRSGKFLERLPGMAGECDTLLTLYITVHITKPDIEVVGRSLRVTEPHQYYTWINCETLLRVGSISRSFWPKRNGRYAVLARKNDCDGLSGCKTVAWVGIEEQSKESFYNLYPNPTKGRVRIDFESVQPNVLIQLYNLNGQLVQQATFNNVQATDYTINGTNGIYLLRVITSENTSVHRIVKQ